MSLFVDYVRSTPLYGDLCELTFSPHGNLLERVSDETVEAQTEFLRWALEIARPTVIVETGTNKGMFGCFLSAAWHGCHLVTHDVWPEAEMSAVMIRDNGRISVDFRLGDSRDTLPGMACKAGFAWIDGGHERDVPLADLVNCSRLGIPYVAIDDTVEPDVGMAVDIVVGDRLFELVPNPFSAHDGRKAVLLKNCNLRSLE